MNKEPQFLGDSLIETDESDDFRRGVIAPQSVPESGSNRSAPPPARAGDGFDMKSIEDKPRVFPDCATRRQLLASLPAGKKALAEVDALLADYDRFRQEWNKKLLYSDFVRLAQERFMESSTPEEVISRGSWLVTAERINADALEIYNRNLRHRFSERANMAAIAIRDAMIAGLKVRRAEVERHVVGLRALLWIERRPVTEADHVLACAAKQAEEFAEPYTRPQTGHDDASRLEGLRSFVGMEYVKP